MKPNTTRPRFMLVAAVRESVLVEAGLDTNGDVSELICRHIVDRLVVDDGTEDGPWYLPAATYGEHYDHQGSHYVLDLNPSLRIYELWRQVT